MDIALEEARAALARGEVPVGAVVVGPDGEGVPDALVVDRVEPKLVVATLAEAVGLTRNGQLRGQWFQDPIGQPNGSERGLSSMMYTDDQREALMAFVDGVLGGPDRRKAVQCGFHERPPHTNW